MAATVNDKSERVTALAGGLAVLIENQSKVGVAFPGWVAGEPEYIRTTFLALVVEVVELLQEFDWRQWRDPRGLDRPKAAGEFADILAFLGYVTTWLVRSGIPTTELAMAYERKTQVNLDRLAGKVVGFGARQTG